MRLLLIALILIGASAVAGERPTKPLTHKAFGDGLPHEFVFQYTKDYREDGEITHRHFWGGRDSKLNMVATADSRQRVFAVEYYFELGPDGVRPDDLRRMRALAAILCPRWSERDTGLDELLAAIRRDRGTYPDNLYRFHRESKDGRIALQPDSSSPAINLTIDIPDGKK